MLKGILASVPFLRIQGKLCNRIRFSTSSQCCTVAMNDRWPVSSKRKAEDGEDESACKKARIKKKMYALLMAYCGQGYLGLQRNMGLKTIEEDVMTALKKIDVVNDEEFQKQQLVNFQRAARTDKGVSAIRQVLSLSMREGVTAQDINEHLPEQIRVLAVKRVTKGFNSKNTCDSRTYSYTCPSFAFAPQDFKPLEEYRITEDVLKNLHTLTGYFMGTHNFHNFTSGRKPFDPSCQRHILMTDWKEPIIRDNVEFVTFLVKGQSFMLHQIRKMIGTVMAVSRGYVGPSYITKAFDPRESAQLPTAPGLGLLLEQVHYDWYDKKYGNNGIHEKLDFADVEEQVQEFREKFILPMILREEKEEKSMLNYLDTLHAHYEEFHPDEKSGSDAVGNVVTNSSLDDEKLLDCSNTNENIVDKTINEDTPSECNIPNKLDCSNTIENITKTINEDTPSECSIPSELNCSNTNESMINAKTINDISSECNISNEIVNNQPSVDVETINGVP